MTAKILLILNNTLSKNAKIKKEININVTNVFSEIF